MRKKSAPENIKRHYEEREKAVRLFEDHSRMKSEAKYRAKHGKGLKS